MPQKKKKKTQQKQQPQLSGLNFFTPLGLLVSVMGGGGGGSSVGKAHNSM